MKIDLACTCICTESGLPLERNGHTATCNREQRKPKPISHPRQMRITKVSGKMAKALQEYSRRKYKWIAGKRCAVFPIREARDIHHMKGRATIELLLDERYWLPVSRPGHIWIENNPKEAKERGYSLNRLAKP